MEFTCLPPNPQAMNTLSTKLPATLLRSSFPTTSTTTAFNLFTTAAASYSTTTPSSSSVIVPDPITPLPQKTKTKTTGKPKVSRVISEASLKENWLNSLSCHSPACSETETNEGSDWVIGVDPDTSGALALLKPGGPVEVFDSPHLEVPVGKRVRKRLDAKSIVQLIQSFDAPIGTTAYIEQSIPFPQDGKQGWWSGGFGYGLWIGILVACGVSVVPVPSFVWKNEFKLSGSRSSKDDSRELASRLFPSLSSMLKRKKDHEEETLVTESSKRSLKPMNWYVEFIQQGHRQTSRAEALLIAAYGQGLRTISGASCIVDNMAS